MLVVMSSQQQEFRDETAFSVETQTNDELLARRLGLQATQAAWSEMIVDANKGWMDNLQEILATDAEIAARGLVRALEEKTMPAHLVSDMDDAKHFEPPILTLVEDLPIE